MALNMNKNLKRYYSIKEVASMFGLNESTLRFWETEFPYLKPKTSGPAKVRQYTESDIDTSLMLAATIMGALNGSDAFKQQLARAREEYARLKNNQ